MVSLKSVTTEIQKIKQNNKTKQNTATIEWLGARSGKENDQS